jgi:ATP-dependent RNA helicase DDX55/SPB4
VSFIRYYKEHQLNFIFSFNLLCIGQAANSFCLFRIPRVKEILGKQLKGFEQNNTVDMDSIPYRDKNKGDQKLDITNKRKEKLQKKLDERQAEEEMQKALKDKNKAEKAQQKVNLTRTEKRTKKREADFTEWDDL